jgi:thiol-disulfide isomerase/thioredoxin
MDETTRKKWLPLVVIVFVVVLVPLCIGQQVGNQQQGNKTVIKPGEIKTYREEYGSACTEDGKPVIRMFSTRTCPHCSWLAPTYESVVREYMNEGRIVAHHWKIDAGDDTLTDEFEGEVPESEIIVFLEFNEKGSVPTLIFGCKYYRIGTAWEREDNLEAEEMEMRNVIDALLEGG